MTDANKGDTESRMKAFIEKVEGAPHGTVVTEDTEIINKYIQHIIKVVSSDKTKITILSKAESLVYGDRNKNYGHPRENFANIAELWNAYLAIKLRHYPDTLRPDALNVLNSVDVAILNILQKIARLATNPHHEDSIVDIAGYAATIERLITGK